MKDLLRISSQSLRANILHLPSGSYLSAGQHQFLTLWTRDFCHSVRGLLAIGETEVVRNHLSFLLRSLDAEGLVPRVVDNRVVQFRVAWQSLRFLVPMLPKLAFKEPLRPQYQDEHGSKAIDSNLLVLLAALELKETEGGGEWWKQHESFLRTTYSYYQHKIQDQLISQPPFSDWQDSARRAGHTFLTNLFYFVVSVRLKKLGWDFSFDEKKFADLLTTKFFDRESGVFRTHSESAAVSLDGNLFALLWEEFLNPEEKMNLWRSLKAHPIVSGPGCLGVCSYPDYPAGEIAFHVKLAKLHGYHGHLAWSWLMGLGLEVASLMNDQATLRSQFAKIQELLVRDGEVLEVYVPAKAWEGWSSWLLQSERPFAWGSAYLVKALTSLPEDF